MPEIPAPHAVATLSVATGLAPSTVYELLRKGVEPRNPVLAARWREALAKIPAESMPKARG